MEKNQVFLSKFFFFLPQVFLYNLMCQLEHFLIFVKFLLKLLVMKIKISVMILRNCIGKLR
jgi:hypothetical protein